MWSERMQIVIGHADLLQIEVPWKVPREVCRILDKESSETIKCWLHQFPYAFPMLVPKRPSPYHTSIPHPPFLSVLQLTPSLSHQMENCWVMHVHSPVEKRHRTKNSYRKLIVFKVVCGDISKSELVLGTLIQRLKNYNFRLHLQSLSHPMEISRAMHVHSPVEKRHHTKKSYRKSIVFKVVCGDINKWNSFWVREVSD